MCAPLFGSAGALRAAAESLADIPHRRKTVLYVSNGKAMKLFPGISDRGCVVRVQVDVEAAVRAAQRGNVNIYGLDPSGLTIKGGGYAGFRNQFLEDISSHTGGWTVRDTNEPSSRVSEILDATSSYYLIGYELPNKLAPNRFHRLSVEVDRPGVEARSRVSRYDPTPPETLNPTRPTPSATELAVGDSLPRADLRIQVTTATFAAVSGSGMTQIALGVQLPTETTTASRDMVDLLIRAFTIDGRPMGSTHEVVPVVLETGIPATHAGGASAGPQFEMASRIELKPGRYTLRIAVHSKLVDKAGSVYADVVVPDFQQDPLSLSGVILTESSGAALRGDAAVGLTPTTTRAFGTADRVQAFLRIYQAGSGTPGPVSMKIRVVDEHDATVLNRTETLPAGVFALDHRADYSVRLPLSGLAAGEYWLSIEAASGKRKVRRDVRFSVKG